ncbi:L-threonylcarbamoyladenylate synthase [Pseudanabaena sp. FACHB-2040]|uniref:L-threonylcarbamoyladenylate synthase n=1 Tax=Pseudanabaena sp. FACHB-2040 TaxID=2692859 RepID=UPI00168A2E3C|nr:L-threonylcarbamoyladenylate synthase [Pseudanabaena sp. FACHB-2040]MBD2256141.1 L-threonylcarbamoyladenylate synthase [Pseudanabaena sp. FACHB-2040]
MPQVSLEEFVAVIAQGQALGSFETDTVPALAARPNSSHLIYKAKQRGQDKPLILMAAALEDLLPYVTGTAAEIDIWRQVTEQFWPGPLTLVLPASDQAPAAMNPQQTGTLGIRVPNHDLARYLLARTGPLATTSANPSGQPPLQTLAEIEAKFPDVLVLSTQAQQQIEQCLGSAPTAPSVSGMPSTVARWQGGTWEILRQGPVRLEPPTGSHV